MRVALLGGGILALLFAVLIGCGGQQANNISGATANASTGAPGATTPPGNPGSGGSTPPSPTAPSPTVPANAKTFSDIHSLPNWENCTLCAGGPTAVYSMTENIGSPSLSGSSAKFSLLSGSAPWSQALWWKYLTSDDSATHFIYDLYFYMDNPPAAQALEFGVSQSAGGNRYEWATQCDLRGDHTWRVWNAAQQAWNSSGVSCPAPAANTWNHLIWEFERNSSAQVVFTAVTLNGNRSAVNMAMSHQQDSSSGIDVAFQIDAEGTPILHSVWLDRVNLTYW
jgi:hypothetical protein